MRRFTKKFWNRFFRTIIVLGAVVLIGALVLSYIEDWRYIDAYYATMMYVTTIGVSGEPVTDGGKVYVSLYSIVGVGAFFYLLALITIQDLDVD